MNPTPTPALRRPGLIFGSGVFRPERPWPIDPEAGIFPGMPEASPTPASGLQAKQPLSLRLVLRFVVAGGFNSLAHIAVFSFLTIAFSGLPGGLLVAVAWAVAIPMAYVVQSTFVWNQQLSTAGLGKLIASYLPVMTLSTALASAAEAVGGSNVHQELAAVASAAVVGFFLQRFWVYRA